MYIHTYLQKIISVLTLGMGVVKWQHPFSLPKMERLLAKKIRTQLVGRFGSKRHNCDTSTQDTQPPLLEIICATSVGHIISKNMNQYAMIGSCCSMFTYAICCVAFFTWTICVCVPKWLKLGNVFNSNNHFKLTTKDIKIKIIPSCRLEWVEHFDVSNWQGVIPKC